MLSRVPYVRPLTIFLQEFVSIQFGNIATKAQLLPQ